ncbi:hypothetical protein Hanom_Chr17g01571901 [Helianthus anomalus]
MALTVKHPHNYLPLFEKIDKNTSFHLIIDVLTSSKYKAILTTNAPIYPHTLRDFWANPEIQSEKKVPYAITSKVGEKLVQISPSSISTTFGLNNQARKTSFEKQELHAEFIKRGYEGQLKGVTIFKPNFPAPMKFFFHTLLTCVSAKTTAFNEIPLKIQY